MSGKDGIRKDKKIKIVYMIGKLDVGGAERQLIELVKGLNKSRFEPIVYTMSTTERNVLAPELEKQNVVIKPFSIRFKGKPIIYPSSIYTILRQLSKVFFEFKKDRPHIFHGYLFWAYIFGALNAKLAGVPIIITSRRSLHTSKTARKKKLYDLLEWIVNRMTDRVIANSRAVIDDTIRMEKIPNEMISCVYNGVYMCDEPLSDEKRAKYLSNWKRSEDEVLIGVVSNLIIYKGHDYLLKAIPLIKERTKKPFRIVLIGRDANNRENLDRIVEDLGIEDDVVFAGSIPRAQRFMPLFDIAALPSLEEGFSNTVIESMATGLPIVATNVGGNPEAVVDAETGFIVPSKDPGAMAEKLALLIEDEEMRKRMGRAASARVSCEFTMDKMVERTQEIYEEILKKKKLL